MEVVDMKILVVDDSKMIRHILATILRELGYATILEAENVTEAKKILGREKIDLILSDWNMPGESGLDLLKNVRQTPAMATIPFIIITTEQDKAHIFDAVKEGVQAYLIKPVKKESLLEKLKGLVKTHAIQPPCVQPPQKAAVISTHHDSHAQSRPIENAPHLGIRLDNNSCLISVENAQQENLSELLPILFPQAKYVYITAEGTESKFSTNIQVWKQGLEKK